MSATSTDTVSTLPDDPRFGKWGKQRCEDTGPLTKERMEVVDDAGLGQMMKGAGMAAAFVIAIGLVLGVIYSIGLLLPAESRDTPDPNTWDTVDRGEP